VPGTETFVVIAPVKALRFWDARTGRLMREFTFGNANIQSFDVAPDGTTVATLSALPLGEGREYSTQLELWDVASGERRRNIEWIDSIEAQSLCAAITPHGRVIATGTRDGKVRFWDISSGEELLSAPVVERGEVEEIAFSPDGERVAVASRGGAYLWEWLTEKKPQKLAGLDRGATSIAFSPDGRWLAAGSDDGVGCRLYDVASAKLVRVLKGQSKHYTPEGIAFDPTGRLLAVPAYESGVELWDVASGQLTRLLATEGIRMREVAISSDEEFLVGIASESTIRVWHLSTGEPLGSQFVGHHDEASEIEFTPDGEKIVSGDRTGVLIVWDADSGRPLHTMGHEHKPWISALKVSPDGERIVSSGHDQSVRVWETESGRQIFRLFGHGRLGGRYKVAIAADGRTFASFGPDMYMRTWDMRTGKCLAEQAVRPQGMMIQEDEEGNVQTERTPFGEGTAFVVMQSEFSVGGDVLLVPQGGAVHVFDVRSGRELRNFAPGGSAAGQFAPSPDGKMLVTTFSQRPAPHQRNQPRTTDLRVIDFATNEVLLHRELDGAYIRTIHFSPDGSLVGLNGVGSGGERDEWTSVVSVESGDVIARVPGRAMEMAFSPDNGRLATSQEDSTVLVWDLAQFRPDED
jgi:WD40 repeat protein